MGQACQLQCLSVVTMETDALPANGGCLWDVFSAIELPVCYPFFIFLKKKTVAWLRFKVWFCVIASGVPRRLNFTREESFSVSLKIFIQRKKDCVFLVKFEARSLTAILQGSLLLDFSFRGFFSLAQQVVRRMWSNFIDLIKSGWFILPISWHPANTPITLATLETDWNIMALPVKRNKLSPVKGRFFKGLT